MRWTMGFVALALTLAAPAAAKGQPDTVRSLRAPRPERAGPGEAELRERLMDRFLGHASRELELTAEQEQRLRREYGEIQAKRRSLIREQREVRRRLEGLNRGGEASDDEAKQLLRLAAELRAREAELWREEQERIGRVLTPGQQARFLMMQERFAERVRAMRERRQLERPPARPHPERSPERRPRRQP